MGSTHGQYFFCSCYLRINIKSHIWLIIPLQVFQKLSATLVHHRNPRTIFICSVIFLMSAASSVGLLVCPMEENNRASSSASTNTIIHNNSTEFGLSNFLLGIYHHNENKSMDLKLLSISKPQTFKDS